MTGNERFTLEPDVRFALSKTPGATKFDLDPAACAESHWAPQWYSKDHDGLLMPWFGHVFVNPPFTDCERWVQRAWGSAKEPEVKSVTMLLPGGRTEQPWWQTLIEPYRDGREYAMQPWRLTTHFLKGRTRFGFPGNPLGVGVGSPPFVCVLVVFTRLSPAAPF